MTGKEIRMRRIMNRNTRRTVIVPMDHGVSAGPISGIARIIEAMDLVAEGGANAVVVHKGVAAKGQRRSSSDMGLIVHLSGSTSLSPEPNTKTLVCTVEEAIQLGADAVSIHVNIGNGKEAEMLRDFGLMARSASQWGMPLLAMIYPRGERIKNEFDPVAICHAARIGAELGADIVKVPYTGSPDSFRKVVDGCHVPVVIAGGARMDSERSILEIIEGAMQAGAAGVSVGRNVFQSPDPTKMVMAMSMIVHNAWGVDRAMELLKPELRRAA